MIPCYFWKWLAPVDSLLCEDPNEAGLESRVFARLGSCCWSCMDCFRALVLSFLRACKSSLHLIIIFFFFSCRTVILSDGPCKRFWVVIMGFIAFLKTQFIVHLLIGFVFVVSGLIINFIQLCTLVLWPINKQFYRRVNCRLAYSLWSREYAWRGCKGWGWGGVWVLFPFLLVKEKNTYIHVYVWTHRHMTERSTKLEVHFFRAVQSSHLFCNTWENIWKSRDWYILSLCYLKEVGSKAPPHPQPCLDWQKIADSVSISSS